MHSDRFVKEICSATEEVFTTMLGLEVSAGEAVAEQSAPGPTNGVVSLIGLAGSWVGTGSISCSAEAACRFSSEFLMTKFASVDEEVLDAIAELTNMIIGGFKTKVEEELGPMGLSIPTVIFGRNFTTRTIGKNNWILVPFTCGEETFEIHICLAPNEQKPARAPRHDHIGLQPVSG
jgi:chemotaxis protein CheX